MSWRSGIFDRHKVAEPYSGGHAAPVAPVAPVQTDVSAPTVPPAKKSGSCHPQKVEAIKATPVLEVPLAGGDRRMKSTEEELAERKNNEKQLKKKKIAKQELRKKLEDCKCKETGREIENQKKESRERKQQQLQRAVRQNQAGTGSISTITCSTTCTFTDITSRKGRNRTRTNRRSKLQLVPTARTRNARWTCHYDRRMLREAQIEDKRQRGKTASWGRAGRFEPREKKQISLDFRATCGRGKAWHSRLLRDCKKPMDLGKVKEIGREEVPVRQTADDMRLIFDNCALYNGTTTDAGQMGETVRAAFEEGGGNTTWNKKWRRGRRSPKKTLKSKTPQKIRLDKEGRGRTGENACRNEAQLAELKRQKAGGYPRDSREGLDGL